MIPAGYQEATAPATNERRAARRTRRTVATFAMAAVGVAAAATGLQVGMNAIGPEPTVVPEGTKAVETDVNHDGQNELVLMLPERGTPEENAVIAPVQVNLPTPPTTER